jgi:hypothetical protein
MSMCPGRCRLSLVLTSQRATSSISHAARRDRWRCSTLAATIPGSLRGRARSPISIIAANSYMDSSPMKLIADVAAY